MARQIALPPTLPPRLILRDAAAAYLSVAPGTLDKMIAEGRVSPPVRLSDGRVAFDVRALDKDVDRLPAVGASTKADETWES
jgi:hypothetical protein